MNDVSMDAKATPEVCVGLPVYRGAASIGKVLENLTSQTHRDLVIYVSDNGNTDGTSEILAEWAAKDDRIKIFRQPETIPATDNFNFVLRKCTSPFFLWAAHDDYRDPDYIEKLIAALKADSTAVLAFGDIEEYVDGGHHHLPLDFTTADKSMTQRLKWAALHQLHHLYGVWRADQLQRLEWRDVDWWHDTPLMLAASQLGEFIHVPGVKFHYKSNQHHFLEPGKGGARYYAKRAGDLVLLSYLAYRTVADVAGTERGLVAAWWTTVKTGKEIVGYIGRRVF